MILQKGIPIKNIKGTELMEFLEDGVNIYDFIGEADDIGIEIFNGGNEQSDASDIDDAPRSHKLKP